MLKIKKQQPWGFEMIDPNFKEICIHYIDTDETLPYPRRKLRVVYRPVQNGYCYSVAINNCLQGNFDDLDSAKELFFAMIKSKPWKKTTTEEK